MSKETGRGNGMGEDMEKCWLSTSQETYETQRDSYRYFTELFCMRFHSHRILGIMVLIQTYNGRS